MPSSPTERPRCIANSWRRWAPGKSSRSTPPLTSRVPARGSSTGSSCSRTSCIRSCSERLRVRRSRSTYSLSGAPKTVLLVHSSSGHYGADRQLLLIASGLDPSRYRPLVALPDADTLAADLRARRVEVHGRELSGLPPGLATHRLTAWIPAAQT